MSTLMAVDGCTLQDTSATPGAPAITINSTPSTKVKAGGGGAFSGGIDIVLASGSTSGSGCALNSPLNGTIPPGATKVNIEGALANIVGDKVTISGPGTTSGGSSCTATFTIEIVNAGQTKVKVE